MEENSKAKQKKPRRPLYDDKEFMMSLEMVKGGRAYSRVRHDIHFTTGLMFQLNVLFFDFIEINIFVFD